MTVETDASDYAIVGILSITTLDLEICPITFHSQSLHNAERNYDTLSQLVLGCVTCHTCHGCMTDFRPILGNPVEVAHMTSPGTVYISHAKGTYFPLAR